jgi:hypothetical protein
MMKKRFDSCGLSTVQPDEGNLIEYRIEDLDAVRATVQGKGLLESGDKMRVVFDAIYNHMERAKEFVAYSFVKFDLFWFRPATGFVEEDGGAKYEIFQVPLLRSGGYDYAYIVIDHVLPQEAEGAGTRPGYYRLRGVSVPQQIATPEYNWCNADYNWLYWNDTPTDFNASAPAMH